MNQLAIILAFVSLILLVILIVLYCVIYVDFSKLLKKIRKRSWEKEKTGD